MTFRVHLQYPKPKDMGLCGISLDKHGQALLLTADGNDCTMEMTRAKVDWMQKAGFIISGFETNGHERNGRPRFRYQEWFCAYVEDGKCPPKLT